MKDDVPLNHQVHPYTEEPFREEGERPWCICGLGPQHHLHVGISSAVCCCMGCIRTRDPDDPYGKSGVDGIVMEAEA